MHESVRIHIKLSLERKLTPIIYIRLQEPNVSTHFTGVASIDETGLIGDDGIHRPCDTIVCATGFGKLWNNLR